MTAYDGGCWIQTYFGKKFDLIRPEPHMVSLGDIAHALSHQCRFNGHADKFYSVAEHCVFMSRLCDPTLAKAALLHDASEAYVGDMVRPLKQLLPDFKTIEVRIERVIAARFHLGPIQADIHPLDLRMLATEARQLLCRPPTPWASTRDVEPFNVILPCWSPKEAEDQFWRRYGEIQAEENSKEQAV